MKKYLIAFILAGLFTSGGFASAGLFDYFATRGQAFPSVEARRPLAEECGIKPYDGLETENIAFEECLVSHETILTSDEPLFGGLVSKPFTFAPNTLIRSSEINQNFDTLYTLVNGNINNANIVTGAAIDVSKISGTAIVASPSSSQSIAATTTFTGTAFVSTTEGFFRVPKMTTAQRLALYGLDDGAMVYDTTQGNLLIREGGAWTSTTPAAATALASLTGKGIVELATGLELASSTITGSTDASLIPYSLITTSSPYTAGYVIPVTRHTAKLYQGFIDLDENFTVNGNWRFVSSTTSTIFNGGFISTASSSLPATTTLNRAIADPLSWLVAGETLTGATLPQAVYIASSSESNAGKVKVADADNPGAVDFYGFARSNVVANENTLVQTNGVIGGFTGLTVGATYYVQDDKTLGTSIGTYEIKVGVAISATQILIQKGEYEFIGSAVLSGSGGACSGGSFTTTSVPFGARHAIVNGVNASNGKADINVEITMAKKGKHWGFIQHSIYETAQENYHVSSTWDGTTITVEAGGDQAGITCTLSGSVFFFR